MLSVVLGTLTVLMAPLMAMAEDKSYDAKLEGYANSVKADPASTPLIWLVVIVMTLLCLGVLFKNAKRSHLD